MEILIWRRLSDEERTSDDVGQIGSYDDQMVLVSIRILPWRGSGGIKGCNRIESISDPGGTRLENLGEVWKTLKGWEKIQRSSKFRGRKHGWVGKLSFGSFAKERIQEILGKIGKKQICWENIFFCGCKTFFVAADMYISTQSKKTFLFSWQTNSKIQAFSALNIFSELKKKFNFSCSADRPINLQLKNGFLALHTSWFVCPLGGPPMGGQTGSLPTNLTAFHFFT